MKGTITTYEPIPTGEYRVFVSNVEDCEGQYGSQIRFTLEVMDDGDYQGRELRAWASANLSTKSKLARWAKACGHPFKAGAAFDTGVGRLFAGTGVNLEESVDPFSQP